MSKRNVLLLLLILLLLSSLSSVVLASWTFTEVFYDAVGNDKGLEWVELVGPPLKEDSLFFDNNGNHLLRLVENHSCSSSNNHANCTIIIADNPVLFKNNFFVNNTDCYLLYDSSFSLSNSGEIIGLIVDGVVANISYPAIAPPGFSISFNGSSWSSTIPNPGFSLFSSNRVLNNCDNLVPEFSGLGILIILLSFIAIFILRFRR